MCLCVYESSLLLYVNSIKSIVLYHEELLETARVCRQTSNAPPTQTRSLSVRTFADQQTGK